MLLVVFAVLGTIAVGFAVWAASQIFRIHISIRITWAILIYVFLGMFLVICIEKAVAEAKVPGKTDDQRQEEYFERFVDGSSWMSRDDF